MTLGSCRSLKDLPSEKQLCNHKDERKKIQRNCLVDVSKVKETA